MNFMFLMYNENKQEITCKAGSITQSVSVHIDDKFVAT